MSPLNNLISHLGKISLGRNVFFQSVRGMRKPRKPFWLGVAKSKKFYVPPVPAQEEAERVELLRLYNNYRNNRKCLKQYMITEASSKDSSSQIQENLISDTAVAESLKANESWNALSAKLREERLAKLAVSKEEEMLQIMEERSLRKSQLEAKVTQLIQLEKEKSKSFITRTNIDEAIAESLASFVDYNYAIDLEGNIFPSDKPDISPIDAKASQQIIHS